MATRDDQRRLTKLARKGKLDGDDGFKQKLTELMKAGFTGEDLDFNEKPYFRSALWEATWKNHETIVKLLVDKKANLQFADVNMRTPLHEAAYYGHMNLVTYFLDQGHPIDPVDNFGQTPLFRACEAGRDEVVEYLIKRNAKTNLLDSHSVTVQHIAAFEGMPDMSQWLLYKGAWKNRFSVEESMAKEPASPKAVEDGAAPAAEAEAEDP
mmetsp:Transcript_26117/g.45460  ORF Transcript_26117/g.45460 Transcript_26117/m.45460 type:complete len:210 (-) Transcript_26117:126-755(-)